MNGIKLKNCLMKMIEFQDLRNMLIRDKFVTVNNSCVLSIKSVNTINMVNSRVFMDTAETTLVKVLSLNLGKRLTVALSHMFLAIK
jgi:hypothetical protein